MQNRIYKFSSLQNGEVVDFGTIWVRVLVMKREGGRREKGGQFVGEVLRFGDKRHLLDKLIVKMTFLLRSNSARNVTRRQPTLSPNYRTNQNIKIIL